MKNAYSNAALEHLRALTIAVAAAALTALATASTPALAKEPIKLAVFDFELEDFSAGGPLAGESPAETARLKLVSEIARKELAKSGVYELVDTSKATAESAKAHTLSTCNGCDADIAATLGAEQSFLGVVHKVSVLVQSLNFQIRDTKTGRIIRNVQADFRNNTDESWSRAVVWLIKNKLLEQPAERQPARSQ